MVSATTLVFQSALPVLLFSPNNNTKLVLRGGTNVSKSPAIEYVEYILLPFLKQHFEISCHLDVRSRGFSSRGGGEVGLTVERVKKRLKCLKVLERGEIVGFTGMVWTARQEYRNVPPPPSPAYLLSTREPNAPRTKLNSVLLISRLLQSTKS